MRYLGRYRYLAAIKTTLDYEKLTHGCGIYLCCIFIYELVPLAEQKQKSPKSRAQNTELTTQIRIQIRIPGRITQVRTETGAQNFRTSELGPAIGQEISD